MHLTPIITFTVLLVVVHQAAAGKKEDIGKEIPILIANSWSNQLFPINSAQCKSDMMGKAKTETDKDLAEKLGKAEAMLKVTHKLH